jgi:radical SAM protein with 4Fe4S-binding SPASM domain
MTQVTNESKPVFRSGQTSAYAVGIGLTNECDLSCAHCYRSQLKLDRLNLAEVKQICGSLPVGSVSLGVGENGLHPQYHEILAWLHSQNIRVALTSNGYSVEVLSDEELSWLHSVEFSIDFPTEAEQDNWRAPGNWRKCWEGVERCQRLGVQTAVMAVMMSTNYNRLGELAEVAARYHADLRFNIYQPVTGDKFSLSYSQFWDGLLDLLGRTEIISISEPLVNALLELPRATQGSPCGKTSLRVLPNGLVSPCTYWPGPDRKLNHLYWQGEAVLQAPAFQQARQVPAVCQDCALLERCGGGCASRRLLRGNLDHPDEYCPIVRRDEALLERIATRFWQVAEFKDMPKAGNACTFMVRARG